MNLVEITLNMLYVYLAYAAKWSPAPLIGFTAAVMTLWKTLLYGLQEYYCSWCSVGHNDMKTLIIYWIIPNGCVLVVSSATFGSLMGSC